MIPRMLRAWGMVALAVSLPTAAPAASTALQDLQEARHARPDLDRGASEFATCAACHGPDGGGTRDGLVPRIGGQHASVLIKQLVDYRHGRRWDIRMEHFTDPHHLENAQAIADVAAYVSTLQARSAPGVGTGELLQHGAEVYAHLCASCHGRLGQGDDRRGVPVLGGQHYEYLRRQIYDAVDGRRPSFSRSHIRLLARLDHHDILGVADFLSRARAPGDLPRVQAGPP